MKLKNVLIIGANGGFGILFSNKLSNAGISVTGIDLQPGPSSEGRYSEYISSDIANPREKALSVMGKADCILLCLPEAITLSSFPGIAAHMRPNSLLLDVLSVKSAIVGKMRKVEREIELMSIHPMFAPKLGFDLQNVVAVEVLSGPLSGYFVSLLKDWGANVTFMNEGQHDTITTIIQVATHAAIISFGSALSNLGYDIDKAMEISTPLHRTLLSLLASIVNADPDVYWKIQKGNPLAKKARQTLIENAIELDEAINREEDDAFRNILNRAKDSIEPKNEDLAKHCRSIFKIKM
ncbi:MAG: prephenate dehydrogenase/arogenate dehydrogenase family protein [bacterium]|nr:prephenate dehydrogenase/arogenate dehydrogenase family protein [bacterium]